MNIKDKYRKSIITANDDLKIHDRLVGMRQRAGSGSSGIGIYEDGNKLIVGKAAVCPIEAEVYKRLISVLDYALEEYQKRIEDAIK
jgi:hypothetical protein